MAKLHYQIMCIIWNWKLTICSILKVSPATKEKSFQVKTENQQIAEASAFGSTQFYFKFVCIVYLRFYMYRVEV